MNRRSRRVAADVRLVPAEDIHALSILSGRDSAPDREGTELQEGRVPVREVRHEGRIESGDRR